MVKAVADDAFLLQLAPLPGSKKVVSLWVRCFSRSSRFVTDATDILREFGRCLCGLASVGMVRKSD